MMQQTQDSSPKQTPDISHVWVTEYTERIALNSILLNDRLLFFFI